MQQTMEPQEEVVTEIDALVEDVEKIITDILDIYAKENDEDAQKVVRVS